MSKPTKLVSTQNLTKRYGSNVVLDHINLGVSEGRLTGFLGPNGAGKTTTIRILLGLLAADGGTAEIFGKCCTKNGKAIRRRIGYLPGDVHLYSKMTGLNTLKHFSRIRKQNCDHQIERLAEKFQLPLERVVRKYSTGMRQKLGLIQALMHKPDFLLLDEPTSALDPLVRIAVFEELQSVVQEGRTVLFSSHSLDEVEHLCDEVIVLRAGKIVEHQQISVLRERALRKITIQIEPGQSIELPDKFHVLNQDNSVIAGTWSGPVQSFLDWTRDVTITDLMIERPDLNDLFMTYYSSDPEAERTKDV